MGSRLELQTELTTFLPNVYFQPPSNISMVYPCIVYRKDGKYRQMANDNSYILDQGYEIMLIEKNPDSNLADVIERHFQSCVISRYYTVDNLNHTILNLYY